MLKRKVLSFIVFFVMVAFLCTAWGGDFIKRNQCKRFKGGNEISQFLKLDLKTAKKTKVRIFVTKGTEILESHRLVLGPTGVCEGKHRGSTSWGYILPSGTQGKDLEIVVFVEDVYENGAPISFQVKSVSTKTISGFGGI